MANREKIEFPAIDANQIRAYAEASTDFNKIHLDESFAKEAGLPTVIAHGMLQMGLAATALERWGYDLSKLIDFDAKFKEKVFVGEKLLAEFLEEDRGTEGLHLRWRLVKSTGEEVLQARAHLL